MIHVRHQAVAIVPVDLAFAHIDDYRNVPDWMFGITRFDPIGNLDQGLGAQYDAAMQIGLKTMKSTVEITEWEQDRIITLSSVAGFGNRSSWMFAPVGDDRTELSVDFGYELPGGLAGRALGKLIEPFVVTAIRQTEANLRKQIEMLGR
ncbi:SRPBCC family protein [Prescottella agglutinans]|uniref:Membrane protein n=1 Tax=Prescottella agglutinans TaxID=1644129 RepID=A0ABT6M8L9_9NOCA|nr:SRPBCC family protein [Prescottella agglutinans]MDH6280101.1 putative membrane protein [Prescottella agglutinans]